MESKQRSMRSEKTQTEAKIQTAILKALHQRGVFCWRQNNHATFDRHTATYRSHTGLRGVPDIIGVIDGVFYGWEVKKPGGRQSADQKLFEKRLTRAGGRYFVVKSVEEALGSLDRD